MSNQVKLDAFVKENISKNMEGIQGPYDLPEGWKWVRLEECCKINPSKSEVKNLPDNLQVTFVPMTAVNENTGRIENPEIRLLGGVRKGYTYFKEGDILFAKITPCMENGKSAIARSLINGIGFGSTEFHVLRPTRDVCAEWIHFYIRQKWFREEAARNMTGSVGQQRVPVEFLKKAIIPLPPLKEQKRIISRLEQLVSRAEEAKRLRKLAREEAEKIMQAALNKVFSRAKEEEWKWAKLGTLLIKKPQYGLTARSSQEKKEVRYIRISDVNDHGELKDDDPRFLDLTSEEYEKYKLEENDILIARSGSVGRVYLHRPIKQKCVFASYLIRFKIDSNKLLPKFFFYFGLSSLYREFVENTLRKVAQPNINAKEYCKLKVPLPHLKEQEEIVVYLDRINGIRKIVSGIQQKTEEELEKLIPSILDKAFRGGL
jgi:type I restriction enzyme S subunit